MSPEGVCGPWRRLHVPWGRLHYSDCPLTPWGRADALRGHADALRGRRRPRGTFCRRLEGHRGLRTQIVFCWYLLKEMSFWGGSFTVGLRFFCSINSKILVFDFTIPLIIIVLALINAHTSPEGDPNEKNCRTKNTFSPHFLGYYEMIFVKTRIFQCEKLKKSRLTFLH